MVFRQETLAAIVSGRIDLAFRRWKRPTVRPGGTQRTAVGVIAIDAVEVVAADSITAADATRAGYAERDDLIEDLERRSGDLYRIELRYVGADPRIDLRNTPIGGDAEYDEVEVRLKRMDARSGAGPWTREYLALIAENPAVRAADLARRLGSETQPFKQRVRRLKELGLTESLEVGYRLSPRGVSLLRRRSG